jgi:hypothetical protein
MRTIAALVLAAMTGCASGASDGSGAIDARDRPDSATPVDAAPVDAPAPDGMIAGAVDTCAQALDLTADALTAGGAMVTGNTTGFLNDVEPPSTCTGYGPDGPDAIYLVTATAGQTITATVTPTGPGWDTSIYVTQTCVLAATCLAGADVSAGNDPETVTWSVTGAGTYYVVVDSYLPSVFGPYSLDVRLQ